jgi:hypothetical protein
MVSVGYNNSNKKSPSSTTLEPILEKRTFLEATVQIIETMASFQTGQSG